MVASALPGRCAKLEYDFRLVFSAKRRKTLTKAYPDDDMERNLSKYIDYLQ
jgi:hypothetical protein